jgi:hypothetical protein
MFVLGAAVLPNAGYRLLEQSTRINVYSTIVIYTTIS